MIGILVIVVQSAGVLLLRARWGRTRPSARPWQCPGHGPGLYLTEISSSCSALALRRLAIRRAVFLAHFDWTVVRRRCASACR